MLLYTTLLLSPLNLFDSYNHCAHLNFTYKTSDTHTIIFCVDNVDLPAYTNMCRVNVSSVLTSYNIDML